MRGRHSRTSLALHSVYSVSYDNHHRTAKKSATGLAERLAALTAPALCSDQPDYVRHRTDGLYVARYDRRQARCPIMQRKRSKPHSFEGQIAAERTRLEERAAVLEHSPEKDALLKKIRQLDTAAHIKEWLTSPGLKPPQ